MMRQRLDPRILDLSPVPPPALAATPEGRRLDWSDIVADAGMRNVATLSREPDIRIHGGPRDFKVPSAAGPTYCLSGPSLPSETCAKGREVLRRLAYGFHDYAAREIVARYHRDLKQQESGPDTLSDDAVARRALALSALKIKRAIRERGEATIGEIAEMTGMAQPNVSRTIATLREAGAIAVERKGRRKICRLI